MLTKTKINKDGWTMLPIDAYVIGGEAVECPEIEDEYEEISPEMAAMGRMSAFRLWGDSMSPEMEDGDVIIVRAVNDCNNGDIAVVSVNGEKATLKKIYKDNDVFRFIPINDNYETKSYTKEDNIDIKIIGVVIELRKKFRRNRYAR
ncbi:MAG: LexA family protein [Candidatus Ornithomonoglobus sp.]